MATSDLGPRRAGLLEAWGEYAEATPESEFHSFGPDNRHERVSQRLEAFLESPTADRFQDLWTSEVLRDAVVGGPSLVLNSWPGTVEDLARQFDTMRAATTYDPAWEESFVATGALWELYGHMDPTSRPILNSTVLTGLDRFGFQKPHGYQDRTGYDRFATAYDSVVGHATAGTDHEVPWHFEIEQCLSMLGELDMGTLTDELSEDSSQSHLAGWQAEGNAGRIAFRNIGPLLDEYIQSRAASGFGQEDTDTWGSNHWESWKWGHAEHIQTNVRSAFDLTALDGTDVEPFLAQFRRAPDVELSSDVPTYLLGGRSGGILWNDFKNRSLEHPEKAAAVLSTLFDQETPLTDRVARFNDFYAGLSSPGPVLSLSTMFLMLTYPGEYIMYKYGKFDAFFDAYTDYTVSTGFDADQYWTLTETCRRLVHRLDAAFEENAQIQDDASMLDIHTLIWVAVNVEDL